MRIVFFGDVVGKAGRAAIRRYLPELRMRLKLDFVTINGENAAGGFGITEKTAQELYDAGADCITLGNHSFDQSETLSFIEREPRLLRPLNYPESLNIPGRGAELYTTAAGFRVYVVQLMGRIFMDALDDPFQAANRALDAAPLGMVSDALIIEIHAEATSEKQAIGHFCDGKASLVIGTHTHIPTADAHIMPNGTAYQTDAGMTGDYDSVIGMQKESILQGFSTRLPAPRKTPARGQATMCGVYVETGPDGLAQHIEPIRIGGILNQAEPILALDSEIINSESSPPDIAR